MLDQIQVDGGVNNMSITVKVHVYFKNLINPLLVTNQSLEELLCKVKEGIISKFEDKLRE